jgi:hypothetical protein
MDRQIFGRGMTILTALYPDYELKDETMELYWSFLKDLGNSDFERAVKHHVSTRKWFPKVSELLEAVQAQGPTAIDTWNLLLAAAETGQKPELDAAAEKALAVLGGWGVFQYTSFDDLQYRFKDFKAALLEARARDNLALVGGEQKALEDTK